MLNSVIVKLDATKFLSKYSASVLPNSNRNGGEIFMFPYIYIKWSKHRNGFKITLVRKTQAETEYTVKISPNGLKGNSKKVKMLIGKLWSSNNSGNLSGILRCALLE